MNAETKGDKVAIVVAQLPIVEHPAYGPKDTGKSNGEFASTFEGAIKPTFLQPGNRLIVIGTTHAPTVVSVNDSEKSSYRISGLCAFLEDRRTRDYGLSIIRWRL